MQCHNNQNDTCFSTNSSFKPYVSPIATLPNQTQEKKEPPKYLPGEKLLIKLGTDRKKEKKKNDEIDRLCRDSVAVSKITKSLSRVLAGF